MTGRGAASRGTSGRRPATRPRRTRTPPPPRDDGAAADRGAGTPALRGAPGEPPAPQAAGPATAGQPRPRNRPPRRAGVPGQAARGPRARVPARPGRRSRARTDSGHVTGAREPRGRVGRVHVPATFAAAAPHQVSRGRAAPGRLLLRAGDLREARHEGRESNLVLFVVDASGSMAARARMGAVKGAVLSLLLDAYQRRDKVGMVTFRGGSAELALPPTFSVEAAAARLAAVPTGGRTPLAAGLLRRRGLLRTERIRDPRRRAAAGPGHRRAGHRRPGPGRPARTGPRGCWRRRACTAWSSTASPARSGWASPPASPSPSAAPVLRLERPCRRGRSVRLIGCRDVPDKQQQEVA